MLSQADDILAHLQRGQTITHAEAFELYGIARLGARIYDLKEEGHAIHTETIKVKTARGRTASIARYSLGEN